MAAITDVERQVSSVTFSEDDDTPVYMQLAEQLRLMIRSGVLTPGTRLPSVQHLGANLGINRNTAHKAYSVLVADGLLTGRRGAGTIVAEPVPSPSAPPMTELSPDVLQALDTLYRVSREAGIHTQELGTLVERYVQSQMTRQSLIVGIAECNPDSLTYYASQLQAEFGVEARSLLIRDLPDRVNDGSLAELDCIVSTFYHLNDVRRALSASADSPELFAIAVRPHLDVLTALESLPRGARVGVAYYQRRDDGFAQGRLDRMVDAVRHSRLTSLTVKPLLLSGKPAPAAFEDLDALLVRPDNVRPIRQYTPQGLRTIEFVNELDDAARAFLRDVFADIGARKSTQ